MNVRIGAFAAFLFAITLVGCHTQEGYKDLNKLYADLPVYLNSPDDAALKAYCYKITPDAGTVAYMKAHRFSYRGLPEALEEQQVSVTKIGDDYFHYLLNLRERLKAANQLNDLRYVGREHTGEALYNDALSIYMTETFILLECNGDTIRYKPGEMLRIDGKWKAFTLPKARL